MSLPENARFTRDHEWAVAEGNTVRIGITRHAADELGDIVFVELPEAGDTIDKDEAFGSIESVKAVSDLIAPLSGEVTEVNPALEDQPELVNESPEEDAWMLTVQADDVLELDELMTEEEYLAYLDEQS